MFLGFYWGYCLEYSLGFDTVGGQLTHFRGCIVSCSGRRLHRFDMEIDVIRSLERNFQRLVFGWLQIGSMCT
jgi:hypothetical protein